MEKRRKNRIILSHRYSDTRFRRKKTGSSQSMGWDKDVLLVSEKDLVLQLPSDLRNWECLTYTKGDYDELMNKIEQYYRSKYHYA